jgi:hypothetical protein
MKLLSIIFFIYWILYTFIGKDIITRTLLNKKIKLKKFNEKNNYKNFIYITNINFLICAYYFANMNNETYFIAIFSSMCTLSAYLIFYYLEGKNIISLIDHSIPFFILLLHFKNNMKINFSYKSLIILIFCILYSTQYKDIYGFK